MVIEQICLLLFQHLNEGKKVQEALEQSMRALEVVSSKIDLRIYM